MNGSSVAHISQGGQTATSLLIEPEPLSLLGSSNTRASLPKPLSAFPKIVKRAVIDIEDERFYSHLGIDPVAVTRAVVVNIQHGKISQGGSTLTQQLAKNLFFTNERSMARKVLEAFSAILIETAFSKDQILEFYLNEVFLGQEGSVAIHGFGEAARSLFDKDVEDLSLAEAATLAGVIKGPTKFSPRRYPERAEERRQLVLQKMFELGDIGEAEFQQASHEKVKIAPAFHSRKIAPYFIDYVRKQVEEVIDLPQTEGDYLKIYTGIDREYQACAETAVKNGLEALEKKYPKTRRKKDPLQAALVSALPASGEILAWVGGRNYQQNQFDRVSMARRQPGSSFKPFVYLTALDSHLNTYRTARTTSVLEDQPITLEIPGSAPWTPQNFDGQYRGDVTVREALTHSLNIPTVNLAMKVGIDSVKRTAELFGFGSNLPAVPSIALGAGEVTPLELARAYATLVDGGYLMSFQPVSDVLLNDRPLLRARKNKDEEQVASEDAIYVLVTILQDVVEKGTATAVRRLGFTRPVAGKTGTSNDARDAWFAGFTPRLLTVVWVGFDDNAQLGLTGGQAAVPIWTEYMKCVSPMEPELDFIPPPGVVFVDVDKTTGLLATPNCSSEDVIREVFVKGTEPVTNCPHGTSFLEEVFGGSDQPDE